MAVRDEKRTRETEDVDALFQEIPSLRERIPRYPLGTWPTPLEPLHLQGVSPSRELWVKREDISSLIYGGNKIRPIEIMLGLAQKQDARQIWSTGSLGSNHAVATALHAPGAGLASGAILFPQPSSETARDNLLALYTTECELVLPANIALFPWSYARVTRRPKVFVQEPGAAVPLGAIGHLSAGIELAWQLRELGAPEPRHIVVPVGSTCTIAGLLVATALARRQGLAFRKQLPTIHGIRVTPWPVTATWRIVRLAKRTAALLEKLGGGALETRDFSKHLEVTGRYQGRGYGHPTAKGHAAIKRFDASGALMLDTTYSAKTAAAMLDCMDHMEGPILYWATKSTSPLPKPSLEALRDAPRRIRSWLHSP